MGEGEELRRFHGAVRGRIGRAAADAGCGVREIPPAVLLSWLCASGFSSVVEAAGIAEVAAVPGLGALLADLISSAIDSVRAGRGGQLLAREDLEAEIGRRMQRALAAEDGSAAALRAEIALVLEKTGAMRSALLSAIEAGDDRLQSDVIAAIDNLSSGFPEMRFLLRHGDYEAADIQRRLDGQGAQFRALGEVIRRQSADVRIVREDLAAIRQRQSLAGRGGVGDAGDAGRGPRWAAGCPYLGLLAFDQAHAEVFCGRQRLTADLMVKLAGRLAGPAMVVVSGASGAGKSSLLQAGLLPALAAGIQLEGSGGWPRVVMTPTADPLTELATRLAALSGSDAGTVRGGLTADPDRAHLVIRQALADPDQRTGAPPPAGQAGRLVLVVDQFEEVFTLNPGRGESGQQAFIAALCAAATQPSGPGGEPAALVVIAVRGDFWARCAAHAGLADMMQDGLFVVGPMTGPELRQAITGPAAAAGLQVDADLADTVLADLRTAGRDEAEGTLPLLSQAMMLTWAQREGNRLTVRGYRETGGVARCVEFGAEAVYQALPEAGQHVAREIFRALVLVDPDGQLARRPMPGADLCPGRGGTARRAVDNVLEAFAGSRLLVLDGDTVQIAHDVLLRAWPRLRGWLDREQASWILYTQLQEDAARWAEHGRDSSFLYRGTQLAAVQQAAASWAADPARYPALTQDQSDFLTASQRAAARGTRRRQMLAASLVVLLIAALTGAGVAAAAARSANDQRRLTVYQSGVAVSRALAAQSEQIGSSDPVTASLLAAAAWRIAPTIQARESMLEAFAQPERAVLTDGDFNYGIAFSPDGRILAAADGTDGLVRLWNVATHRLIGTPLPASRKGTGAEAVAFSPNGQLLATAGDDGTVRLWNVATDRQIGAPLNTDSIGNMEAVAFSPDGQLLATTSFDGTAQLWDVATHHELGLPMVLGGSEAFGGAAAFSPDGKILATVDDSGIAKLWDVATQREIGVPMTAGALNAAQVAFSPDGQILATANGTVRLWDVATHRQIGAPLPGGGAAAFSPDGQILATAGGDGTVRLWDVATHRQVGPPMAVNSYALYAVVFNPDGQTIATVGADGTIRLWDVDIYRQIGAPILASSELAYIQSPANVSAMAFSPSGQILATTYGDGTARLWDVATHRQIGAPITASAVPPLGVARGPLPPGVSPGIAFSPDGRILATISAYGTVRLWDVATQRQIGAPMMTGRSELLTEAPGIVFSPDGNVLAIATNGTVRLWNVATQRQTGAPIYASIGINAIAFSPDGKIIAIADVDGTAKLFDAATHGQIGATMTTGSNELYSLAFSPDGQLLATAAYDGTVQLWDVGTQHQTGAPMIAGPVSAVAVAFSPGGQILATEDNDGTARLWDVATQRQIGASITAGGGGSPTEPTITEAFSPDGKILATAVDGTILLINVAFPGDLAGAMCAIADSTLTRQQWNSYAAPQPYQNVCP